MNRLTLAIIFTILACIVGGGAYLTLSSDSSNSNSNAQNNSAAQSTSDSAVQQQDNHSQSEQVQGNNGADPGVYKDYDPSAVTATAGTKLLFFYAPWCPQCRALESDIESKGVPSGVTIFKVDFDSSQSLRQKYGVTLQTTIVEINDSGDLVEKFVAYDDPSVSAIKENLL